MSQGGMKSCMNADFLCLQSLEEIGKLGAKISQTPNNRNIKLDKDITEILNDTVK